MASVFTSQPRINDLAVRVIAIAVLAGAVSVGFILVGFYWLPFALFGVVITYGAILQRWKWGIYGLLIYLPFAGIPTILLYPAPTITLLLKDLLFVLPVYVGFLVWRAKNSKVPIFFPGAPVSLLALLAGLIIAHLFNPRLINGLVGLIGLKVWLFYIPLYFLGYHLIDSPEELLRLAKLMLGVAIVPVLIGLIEAILVYSGYSALVYSLYGDAAVASTQGYFGTPIGAGQNLARIPSTFTFVTQYFSYLLSMLPISYAVWMVSYRKRQGSTKYFLILGLIILAGLLSGSRGTFVTMPFLLLIAGFFSSRNWHISWRPIVAVAAAVVLVAGLLGTTVSDLFNVVSNLAGDYLRKVQIGEFIAALNTTFWGIGTGMNTGPARYAFSSITSANELVGFENLYAKVVAELGVPGLVIVLPLFGVILWRVYAAHHRLKNPNLQAFSAALLAFLVLEVIYFWKGAYLDYDPVNVFFWLFAGMAMKLPRLEAASTNLPKRVVRAKS